MAVYIDNMNACYRGMVMCHMVADTLDELHEMADKIGVDRKWFQCLKKASYPHYDICLSKKRLAIQYGAVEINDKRILIQKARQLKVEYIATK